MDKEKCIDYAFALVFVCEVIFLCFLFIYNISIVGYIVPIGISIVAIIVTIYAVRDYFRQHK